MQRPVTAAADDPPPYAASTLVLGGELTVRRMGFGAMWATRKGPENGAALLRRVLELGVNFIDTADVYDAGASESLIAEALYPYPKDLVIATKGGQVVVDGGPAPDCRPEHLRAACEASLRRLRLDAIDLYQIHNPDPKVPLEESLGALAELRAEGKIRQIGISNFYGEALSLALSTTQISSVQNQYNLEDRSSEGELRTCEREGVAFIPYRPIASGALASADGRLAAVAAQHGATPAQVALAWLLQRSPAMLPIPGSSAIQHLEENVVGARLQLTGEELTALDEDFRVATG
jgi:pyridoxine 4-dehydrogenase